jgi:hypothetical protein
MTDPRWHLAQLNVGRLLAPLEEAPERLERLRRDGPTLAAFTFRMPCRPDAVDPGDPLVDAEFCWPELAAS